MSKEVWKVLFCGKTMKAGFDLTKLLASSGSIVGADQLDIVQCDVEDMEDEMRDTHVAVPLMCRVGSHTISQARSLKMILQFGVGVEGIDIPAATRLGAVVSNIPSAGTGNALACAEHSILLTLALLRNWNTCQDAFQNQRLGEPCGETLHGKNIVILGFGNIAKELIPRLSVFGVHMSCDEAIARILDKRGLVDDLPLMLPNADIVIVTAAQTAETHGMVNKDFLSHCKKGVRFVNVARGGLLDYEAIKDGLESNLIGGLGLDVHWKEPFDPNDFISRHPQVVMTPHIAGVTQLSYGNMARVVIEETLRVKNGLSPTVCLN